MARLAASRPGEHTADRISIVIIDDHLVVREGLKLLLNAQSDMMVVGEAADGNAALPTIVATCPSIVLLDLALRGLHGVAITLKLRELCPSSKVLAFTVHEEATLVREMMDVGAHGYVLKRSSPDELLSAIRTIAKGGSYLDRSVAGEVPRSLPRVTSASAAAEHATQPLSNRETEVLRLLAVGHTNKDIAESLGVSVKTVETYKARVMSKLKLERRVDIVRYASRRGWLADL